MINEQSKHTWHIEIPTLLMDKQQWKMIWVQLHTMYILDASYACVEAKCLNGCNEMALICVHVLFTNCDDPKDPITLL